MSKAETFLGKFENFLEGLIFSVRWVLVPFYLGLSASIILLFIKFAKEFGNFVNAVFYGTSSDAVIGLLTMIDVVFLANLLLIIIFAGYENFVSKINTDNHEDRPDWMGHVGFAELKLKLMGSIVAISGIELLKAFVTVQSLTNEQLGWKVGIHLTFVFSILLFAAGDWLSHKKH